MTRKKETVKKETGSADADMVRLTENQHWSLFTDYDVSLFKAGKHYRLYEKFGAHEIQYLGVKGTVFSVWAPNARNVAVIGDFNGWNRTSHPMNVRWDSSGIWEIFVPDVGKGAYYKYFIESNNGYTVEKADPYAFLCETPPHTASVMWDTRYKWTDQKWLRNRAAVSYANKPVSIYEIHAGSWRRVPDEGNRCLSYRELARELPGYCAYMNFTHVEFMPVMEHPFYGSWGYQITGYFAPDSRYGTPQDFMYLIDELHKAGIGVILDWVPSHFPGDEHGLVYFDGTHLYEHEDPAKGFHQDWHSYIFNYGRNEVRSFLISNALFWLDYYHIDGLRVDAVASMLYLDYSRKEGEWSPNEFGGRENLEAVAFLKEFNEAVHHHHPGVFTVAEESTAWPGVTAPVINNGLGFDIKWMMGWMHDTLFYFSKDPVYRSHHQDTLSFSIFYAFSEKFMLPLSHDEVVYGKKSLIAKMPGDIWQQFANLRLLFGYMFGHPGAKMIFMGGEFAQRHEWRHEQSLDWDENNHPSNQGVQLLLRDLNKLYQSEPALHEHNFSYEGFEWIDFRDAQNSVLCWMRKGQQFNDHLIFVANFTPIPRENYRIGVPARGAYEEVLNTDGHQYAGSGNFSNGICEIFPIVKHGRTHSVSLRLPPLAVIVLKMVTK